TCSGADAGVKRYVKWNGYASVCRYRCGVGWRKGSGLRACFYRGESSKRVGLRPTKAVAVVGSAPRRSTLRENRQFPRAETVEAAACHAIALAKAGVGCRSAHFCRRHVRQMDGLVRGEPANTAANCSVVSAERIM